MPELPEVETIVRGLSNKLVGSVIDQLDVRLPKMIWIDDVRSTGDSEVVLIKQLVEGQSIINLRRRGKMIIVELSNDYVLLIHLKMTGQLVYLDAQQQRLAGGHPTKDVMGDMPNKTTHVIFHFADGSTLFFNDQRQFGYLKVLPASGLVSHKPYTAYGPEPFSSQMTANYLMNIAKKRPSQSIKEMILDQSVIAGIGNIYADESLFASKIYPKTKASSINQEMMEELIRNIKIILQKGIDFGGTSSQHYVQADGQQGTMQDHLMVYRRSGLPCLVCGTPIERMVIGGRGTHYCPSCQPARQQQTAVRPAAGNNRGK